MLARAKARGRRAFGAGTRVVRHRWEAGTRVARHRPYQALKTTVSIVEGLIFNEILRVEGPRPLLKVRMRSSGRGASFL